MQGYMKLGMIAEAEVDIKVTNTKMQVSMSYIKLFGGLLSANVSTAFKLPTLTPLAIHVSVDTSKVAKIVAKLVDPIVNQISNKVKQMQKSVRDIRKRVTKMKKEFGAVKRNLMKVKAKCIKATDKMNAKKSECVKRYGKLVQFDDTDTYPLFEDDRWIEAKGRRKSGIVASVKKAVKKMSNGAKKAAQRGERDAKAAEEKSKKKTLAVAKKVCQSAVGVLAKSVKAACVSILEPARTIVSQGQIVMGKLKKEAAKAEVKMKTVLAKFKTLISYLAMRLQSIKFDTSVEGGKLELSLTFERITKVKGGPNKYEFLKFDISVDGSSIMEDAKTIGPKVFEKVYQAILHSTQKFVEDQMEKLMESLNILKGIDNPFSGKRL